MNDTVVSMVGNAATEVRLAQTNSGVPVASFRLASTVRRYDRTAGAWVDGDTSFVTVWAYRWLAENVAGSVSRGDPVLVTGRLKVREWDRDGRRQTAVEVEARAVGHDLARGTSAFRRVLRRREGEPAPFGAGAVPGVAAPAAEGVAEGAAMPERTPVPVVAATTEKAVA